MDEQEAESWESLRRMGVRQTDPARDKVLRLVREDMERATAECHRVIAESLYGGRPFGVAKPVPAPTFRDKLYRKWLRVEGYCRVLWMALCGVDLVEYAERDDY